MYQLQLMNDRGQWVSGQVFDTLADAEKAGRAGGGVWRTVWGPKKLEAARRLLGIK